MTMFEKVLGKFGLALMSRLQLATDNKEMAFDVNADLNVQLDIAMNRLSIECAKNQRLLAENADLRAEVAGHVRVIGVLMDEVAERVPA